MTLGVIQVGSRAPRAGANVESNTALRFTGRNRAEAKRAALSYWYRHRERLALTLRDFFAICRLSSDERTIFFLTTRRPLAEMREP